jgi:hypothetical protein
MKNIETNFSNLAKSAVRDLHNWGGIENVTEEMVLGIMNLPENREYYVDEISFGYDEEDEGGLDTCVRDVVFDDVSKYYTGESWPLKHESARDFNTFHSNLVTAISEKA